MKFWLSAVGILALLVGILWWRLDVVSARAAASNLRADMATQQLAEQKSQAEVLGRRLDAFDASLKTLGLGTAENNRKLGETLKAINEIQKTEGDSDESISCLDVRVPGQLGERLR